MISSCGTEGNIFQRSKHQEADVKYPYIQQAVFMANPGSSDAFFNLYKKNSNIKDEVFI